MQIYWRKAIQTQFLRSYLTDYIALHILWHGVLWLRWWRWSMNHYQKQWLHKKSNKSIDFRHGKFPNADKDHTVGVAIAGLDYD